MGRSVTLGLLAPSIAEQFPEMDKAKADNFQRDQADLSRLKFRGLLTDLDHEKAIARLLRKLAQETRS